MDTLVLVFSFLFVAAVDAGIVLGVVLLIRYLIRYNAKMKSKYAPGAQRKKEMEQMRIDDL